MSLVFFIKPYLSERNQKAYIIVTFLILLIVHAFVDINSVSDLYGYRDGFLEFSQMSFSDILTYDGYYARFEIGFRYFNKIVSILIGDFRFLLIIYAFIFLKSYYFTIKKCSPYVWVSIIMLLLGPFDQSIYVIRQHFAIALLFASIPLFIEKQYYKTILLVLVAFSLHTTAFVFTPVYFLYFIKDRKKLVGSFIIFAVCLSVAYNVYFTLTGDILENYETYINSDESGQNNNEMIMALAFLVSYVAVLKNRVFEEGVNKVVFIIATIGFLLALVGTGFFGTGRLVMYYSVIPIILVPITMHYIRSWSLRFFFCAGVIILKFYVTYLGGATREMVDSFNLCFL